MARRKRGTAEQQALRALISELLSAANVQSMEDIQNLFKETIAEFVEGSLESELDAELGYEPYNIKNKTVDNSRNGHSKKTLKTSMGSVEIDIPRDRNGDFEPQILRKNQTSISVDMENKIISMYAKGMSTSDIEEHIRDIYGLEVSDTTVSRITDKVLPAAKEWQQRPLESAACIRVLSPVRIALCCRSALLCVCSCADVIYRHLASYGLCHQGAHKDNDPLRSFGYVFSLTYSIET